MYVKGQGTRRSEQSLLMSDTTAGVSSYSCLEYAQNRLKSLLPHLETVYLRKIRTLRKASKEPS